MEKQKNSNQEEFKQGTWYFAKSSHRVNKLQSKWEGPFIVIKSETPSAFRLQTLDGEDDPYSGNEDTLQNTSFEAAVA